VAVLIGPASARITEQDEFNEPNYPRAFETVPLAGPFEFPWSIAFLPDRSILVTERAGRLQLIKPGSPGLEVGGVPAVVSQNHSGLLEVAVDPNFAQNETIYLSYVHGTKASSTIRVMRAKLDVSDQKLREQEVIFESAPAANTRLVGGRVVVMEGYLFLTLGDRWQPERAQTLSGGAGSIIRIRTDGSVPVDNPFVSVPGARPEIWSYGHRNPQGLAFDTRTGRLWSHEHGPKGGDELNLILAGRNYGWPVITHGLDYSGHPIGEGRAKGGLEQPLYYWTPAIAPSGLAIERVGGITVFWIGSLIGQSLIKLEMDDGRIVREERLFRNELGRVRDVRIGPDGLLYVITDDREGMLYRLEP